MDFFARIAENPIVLTIPILGAIIGWVERWAAIRMMFYPTEFVGIKPFLGWQGIVPANAKRLARMSTRLILTKLLTLEELFASFKGDAFAKEMKPVVDQITNQVIDEVAAKRAPMLRTNAGEFMQKQIRDKVSEEVTALSVQVVDDFSANITEILDLEKVSVDAAERDKKLMSEMFLEVAPPSSSSSRSAASTSASPSASSRCASGSTTPSTGRCPSQASSWAAAPTGWRSR
mgnify:CR=1 FL=1